MQSHGRMWNKTLVALALSIPTLACNYTCITPEGLLQSSQSSGSASLTFDTSALTAEPPLSTLDQGALDVTAFGVMSTAEFGRNYNFFTGEEPGPHAALRESTGDDVLVWFRLSDASVLSCKTTVTKLSAGTSALSDLCDAAGLSVGAAGQSPYVVALLEAPQGAGTTDLNTPPDTLAMSGAFIVYVDLRSVVGTVTSTRFGR